MECRERSPCFVVERHWIRDCVQAVYVERTLSESGVRSRRAVIRRWRSCVMDWRRERTEVGRDGIWRCRKEAFVEGFSSRVRGRACLVRWVPRREDMALMCCGRDWYARLFCSSAVSEGLRFVVIWRVRSIISSVTSCGRGVSVVLVSLVREGRADRFSSVRGRFVSAFLNIRVFAASICRRCNSYV